VTLILIIIFVLLLLGGRLAYRPYRSGPISGGFNPLAIVLMLIVVLLLIFGGGHYYGYW